MVGLKIRLYNRYHEPVMLEDIGKCKYRLTFDGSHGMTLGIDRSIHAIDPSGGPYISVGSDLSEYVTDKKIRRNLVVESIEEGNKCYILKMKKNEKE